MPFDTLHKAKVETGLDADLPMSPEGPGDLYWSTDANGGSGALYLTNDTGDTWVEFNPGSGAISLGQLNDVDTLGATTGQVLTFNGVAGEWQPQNIAQTLGGLTDVDLTGLNDGDTIVYDAVGGTWVRLSNVVSINDLSDVNPFVQTQGDLLASDGTHFDTLSIGSDGDVLIADSSEPLGLAWGTSFNANLILTANGQILVDANGNVITEPA